MQRRLVLHLPVAALAGSAGLGMLPGTAATARAQSAAPALPAELATELPTAQLRGSATMRWLGLAIYDIALWSPVAVRGEEPAGPLALSLRYARSLKGRAIAERSLEEMRRIGQFSAAQGEAWLAAMTRLFPDVGADDRLTGVHQPGRSARFFHNGQWRGEVADGQFASLFFGIWLSPRTSGPGLRRQLLGAGA